MSKFMKALEQAQRDRELAAGQDRAEATAPEASATRAADPVEPPPPRAPLQDSPAPAPFSRPPAVARTAVEIPEGVDDHLVSLVAPSAFEAEQYRALRYLVEQMHRTDNLTVVAVSSAGVGDGKTTTSINLAGALAQSPEARVLLVEADLRRPSVAQQLGLNPSGTGLVHAIVNPRLTLAQVTRHRAPFNLNVVLAGQSPPSPYEILKSPRLVDLLDEARGAYDYVILDTPPLVGFQDSRVITRSVDGIILVVGAHRTPRRLLEEALNVSDPAKVLGFVFNGDDQSLARFYGYYDQSSRGAGRAQRGWGRAIRKHRAATRRTDPDGDEE
jgi:capsular exopolysaccharide synthesis family protein